MGEFSRASPWTLSEMLLMVFQRRVSLSDYEDMFFNSVTLLFWLGVRNSRLMSGTLVVISAVCLVPPPHGGPSENSCVERADVRETLFVLAR